MFHEAACLSWSSGVLEEQDPGQGGNGLASESEDSRQRINLLSSVSFIQAASMAQIKSGSSLLKDPD